MNELVCKALYNL